jgi:hypothetical protein
MNTIRDSPQNHDSARIVQTTALSGKTYGFDTMHNPYEPVTYWFQETPQGKPRFFSSSTRSPAGTQHALRVTCRHSRRYIMCPLT